jgi:CubicO group peptidase (beta-lactamase class C family)
MTEPYDVSMAGTSLQFSPARIFDAASFPSGGAGLAGTARDYLRFLEALRTGGAPILKPTTASALHENQIGDRDVAFLGPGGRFGFGVAVVVDPAAAKTPRGRGTFGWGGAYGTTFWVDPEARLSVVGFTNVAGITPFGNDFEKAIYEPAP